MTVRQASDGYQAEPVAGIRCKLSKMHGEAGWTQTHK